MIESSLIESSLLLGGGVEIENLGSDATCQFKVETVKAQSVGASKRTRLTCGYNLEVFYE